MSLLGKTPSFSPKQEKKRALYLEGHVEVSPCRLLRKSWWGRQIREKEDRRRSHQTVLGVLQPHCLTPAATLLRGRFICGLLLGGILEAAEEKGSVSKPIVPLAPFPPAPPSGKQRERGRRGILFQGSPSHGQLRGILLLGTQQLRHWNLRPRLLCRTEWQEVCGIAF